MSYLTEWKMNFSNGVIFGESIVIVAMKVQYTGLKFVDGESWNRKKYRKYVKYIHSFKTYNWLAMEKNAKRMSILQ